MAINYSETKTITKRKKINEIPETKSLCLTNPFIKKKLLKETEDVDFSEVVLNFNVDILAKNSYFNKSIMNFNKHKGFHNLTTYSLPMSFCKFTEETLGNDEMRISSPIIKSRLKTDNDFFQTEFRTEIENEEKMLISFLSRMKEIDILENQFIDEELVVDQKSRVGIENSLHKIMHEENSQNLSLEISRYKSCDLTLKSEFLKETNNIISSQNNSIINFQSKKKFIMECIEKMDIQNLKKALENIDLIELNTLDEKGETPLLYAVKISKDGVNEQNEIVRLLLNAGSDPKIRNKNNWSPLDEAISNRNVKNALFLFDCLSYLKKQLFEREKLNLISLLDSLPDFFLEMKWEFESSIIPFIGKLAPSDTVKIWKYKNSIRMDYHLVGIKNLKSKKRDISIIFNPFGEPEKREDYLKFENGKGIDLIWLVNRSKNFFTNPLQEIDFYEKKAILYDLLTSSSIEGSLKITKCEVIESKNWMGNNINTAVNGWKSIRYDMNISYNYFIKKKYGVKNNKTEKNSKNSTNKELGFMKNIENFNFDVPDVKETKISTGNSFCNLWITEDFPLKFNEILPLISLFSKGNNLMGKLNDILENEVIKSILKKNGFPIKVQIPIYFSIKANISFNSFKLLDKNKDFSEIFTISNDIPYCDRKIAQKTLERTKKRLFLANILI